MPVTAKDAPADWRPGDHDAIRLPKDHADRVYPCAGCGTLRSKDEGGTTFVVCDGCWNHHCKPKRRAKCPKK